MTPQRTVVDRIEELARTFEICRRQFRDGEPDLVEQSNLSAELHAIAEELQGVADDLRAEGKMRLECAAAPDEYAYLGYMADRIAPVHIEDITGEIPGSGITVRRIAPDRREP